MEFAKNLALTRNMTYLPKGTRRPRKMLGGPLFISADIPSHSVDSSYKFDHPSHRAHRNFREQIDGIARSTGTSQCFSNNQSSSVEQIPI